VLECVVNLSEGRSGALLDELAAAAGDALADRHADPWHNRSVWTLVGDGVDEAARALTSAALDRLDLARHEGAHPRLGVVDVVPFVPFEPGHLGPLDLAEALAARRAFAEWAARTHGLPCFYYGPERTLPDVRRRAFRGLDPDVGEPHPHPRWGATCVGARQVLVAYNLWLAEPDVELARSLARELRSPAVRALGLELGGRAQVSCNLVAPELVGPDAVFDAVRARTRIERAELVGLVPAGLLERIPRARHAELDLGEDRTIEARLARRRRGGTCG